ncbi:MAG: MBL fold metallo-hydrolase [Dehalococcoidales bacterium]|nr:MBL fold metallo-hydrolase [Dehalococcoidales bacterium]
MDETPSTNTITFLGTAGARFMVTKQLTASGGMWLNLEGTELLLDPGPGCIVQSTKRKLRAEKLSGIILSHRHIDHSGDINIMAEAMTEGGFKRRGWLFAPSDALGDEPVIYSYLRKSLEGIEVLQEGKSYTAGNVKFSTPVRHIHAVETYGIRFEAAGHTLSYIADTRYFDALLEAYKGSELLILNVVLVEPRPGVDHLTVADAARIVKEIKPKVAILDHFGMGVWKARPWEIAERLTGETGFKVMAARDGMKFELAQLD